MLPAYLTLSYDRNHSETNNHQTNACATIRDGSEISPICPILSRRRKDHGVCDRSAPVWHNRGNISMADACGCWCTRRISSTGAGLANRCVSSVTPCSSWLLRDQSSDRSRFSCFLAVFFWQTAETALTAVRLEHLAEAMC